MSQTPSLRLKKKKNLRQVNNPQKNAVGDQDVPFANCKNRRKSKARCSSKSYHLIKAASHKTKNIKFEHDQGQATMGRRDGKVKYYI